MSEPALSPAERELLSALNDLGVAYLVVGLSAAALQGARVVTQDIDLWFEDRSDPRIAEAVKRAGGVWVPGNFGMPPMIGGDALGDRFDVVLTMSGLESFAREARDARVMVVDGVALPVLPLARIVHSKRRRTDQRRRGSACARGCVGGGARAGRVAPSRRELLPPVHGSTACRTRPELRLKILR